MGVKPKVTDLHLLSVVTAANRDEAGVTVALDNILAKHEHYIDDLFPA